MRTSRGLLALALALVIAPVTPGHACARSSCMPTPAECAAGSANGFTPGSEPTRFALCVGISGHTVAYAGGDLNGPCGDIVVADTYVAGDPSTDPNDCAARSDPPLAHSHQHEEWIASGDHQLHADVYRPDGIADGVRTPVLLVATPYGNSGGTGDLDGTFLDVTPLNGPASTLVQLELAGIVPAIFDDGFTVVVVTMSGFGGSSGCNDFGGPEMQQDVKDSVEWAADRSWSTGKVGVWGFSSDARDAVMALAEKPAGLAAVVVQSPPIDRYGQTYMNGVPYWSTPVDSAGRYTYIDEVPPAIFSSQQQLENWALGMTQAGCDGTNLTQSMLDDPTTQFWRDRDLTARASGSTVPVLFSQGFLDSNVKPTTFLPFWDSLQGPHHAWFGQYEHVPGDAPEEQQFFPAGAIGRDGFKDESIAWLRTYVAGVDPHDAGLDAFPNVVVERSDGVWHGEDAWPAAGGAESSMDISTGMYMDSRGNSAEAANPARDCPGGLSASRCTRTRNGIGAWTFGAPLTAAVEIAGATHLDATVQTLAPGANFIALVYDVDAAGKATLLTRGASSIPNSGTSHLSFDLSPQDWLVRAGDRIGVLLTGADDGWFAPNSTNTPVTVVGGTLRFDTTTSAPGEILNGTLSQAGRDRAPFTVTP